MPTLNNNTITCEKCGKAIPANLAYKTKSPFFPLGYIPYCSHCLSSILNLHNLTNMDKLCQWADWPFNAPRYMLLCKGNLQPEVSLNLYYKQYIAPLYADGYSNNVDWSTLNEQWKTASEKDPSLSSLLPEKQKEKENELRDFWEVDLDNSVYTIDQLEHLQKLYSDLERTQNIATGAQADQAKKLCRLSLDMDIAQRNHELELYAKLMSAYTALVKIAEFTPKSSQSNSSFESVGELVAFLEKTGFINKFYDGEQRDIVDKTIKNQQIFLRRLVSGESNLSERIEQRLQRMQVLDRMEDGTSSEEEWSYDLSNNDDYLDTNTDDFEDADEDEDFEVEE